MWHLVRQEDDKGFIGVKMIPDNMVGLGDYYNSLGIMRDHDRIDNFTGMECPHCTKNHTYIIEKSTSWTSKGPTTRLKGGCVDCGVSFTLKLVGLDH